MKRREALKQLFVLGGGIWIATSCHFSEEKASIQLTSVDFSAEDEALLKRIADAVIPATDSPGGGALNLHLFVMKMIDDCTSPQDQQHFIKGLAQAKKHIGTKDDAILPYITQLPEEDRFSTLLKSRLVQGYLNSEYVMTHKLIYELVPGRYNGAVNINA